MSIQLTFCAKAQSQEALRRAAEELAEAADYRLESWDKGLWFSICPMGALQLNWEEEEDGQLLVEGECYSTPAGAGLHKAAVELVDRLAEKALSQMRVEDSTDYYLHRDFERLKREHFYPWLSTLVRLIGERLKEGDYTNICLCWDTEQYQPENIPGTVVTPMGRFQIPTVLEEVSRHGIEWLAERFFIWDREEKDARYYRNCALNLMWEHCYYIPSGQDETIRANHQRILELLETAAGMDQALPLPVSDYREICALEGHKPSLPEAVQEYKTEYPIGYRKGLVTHVLGCLRIILPGAYRDEWEEWEEGRGCDCWYVPGGEDPVWRVNGYRRNNGDAELSDRFGREADLEDMTDENSRARWGWHLVGEGDASYYQVYCEIARGPSLFVITVSYQRPEEREDIYRWLRRLKMVEEQPVQEQTESYTE